MRRAALVLSTALVLAIGVSGEDGFKLDDYGNPVPLNVGSEHADGVDLAQSSQEKLDALTKSADGMRLLARVADVVDKNPEAGAEHLNKLLAQLSTYLRSSEEKAKGAFDKVDAMCTKSLETSEGKEGEYSTQVKRAAASLLKKKASLKAAKHRLQELQTQAAGTHEEVEQLKAQTQANEAAREGGQAKDAAHADALAFLSEYETRLAGGVAVASDSEVATLRQASRLVNAPAMDSTVDSFITLSQTEEPAEPHTHVEKVYALLGKLRGALLNSKVDKADAAEQAQASYEADKMELDSRLDEVGARRQALASDVTMLQSDIAALEADIAVQTKTHDEYAGLLADEEKFSESLTAECKEKRERFEHETAARKNQLRILHHTKELVDTDLESLKAYLADSNVQAALQTPKGVQLEGSDKAVEGEAMRFRRRAARLSNDQGTMEPAAGVALADSPVEEEDEDDKAARLNAELANKVRKALAKEPMLEPGQTPADPEVGQGLLDAMAPASATGCANAGTVASSEEEGENGEAALNDGEGGLLMPADEDAEMKEEMAEGEKEAARLQAEMDAAAEKRKVAAAEAAKVAKATAEKEEAVKEAEEEARKEIEADEAKVDEALNAEKMAAIEAEKVKGTEAKVAAETAAAEDAAKEADAEVAALKAKLAAAEAKEQSAIVDAEHEALSAAEAAAQQERELETVRADAKKMEAAKEAADHRLEAAQQEVLRARQELHAKQAEVNQNKDTGASKTTLDAMNRELDRAEVALEKAEAELAAARADAVNAATGAASAETTLESAEGRLSSLHEAEESKLDAEQTEKKVEQEEIESLEEELRAAEKEDEAAKAEAAKKEGEKATAAAAAARAAAEEEAAREKVRAEEHRLVAAEAHHATARESVAMQASQIPQQEPLLLQPCGLYAGCVECTADNRCGWIPPSAEDATAGRKGRCASGDAKGPYFVMEKISGWSFGHCPTTPCESYTDCTQCVNAPGCGFCGATMACAAGNVEGPAQAEICPEEQLRTWAHKKRALGARQCPVRQRILTEGAQAQEYAVRRARVVAKSLAEAEAEMKAALEGVTAAEGTDGETAAMSRLRAATERVTPLRREKYSAMQAVEDAETGEARSYEFGYKSGVNRGQRDEANRKGYLHGLLVGLAKVKNMRGPQGPRGLKGDRGAQGEVGPVGPRGATGAEGHPGDDAETILEAYAKQKKVEAEEKEKLSQLQAEQNDAEARKRTEEAQKAMDMQKGLKAKQEEQTKRVEAKEAQQAQEAREAEESEKAAADAIKAAREKKEAADAKRAEAISKVRAEIAKLEKQAKAMKWDPESWERQVEAAEEASTEAKDKSDAAAAAVTKAESEAASAKSAAEAAAEALKAAEDAGVAGANLETARDTATEAREEKTQKQGELAELEKQMRTLTAEAGKLEKDADALEKELAADSVEDAVERQGMQQKVQAKRDEAAELAAKAAGFETKIAAAQKAVAAAQTKVDAAEKEVAAAEALEKTETAALEKKQAAVKTSKEAASAAATKVASLQEKADAVAEAATEAKTFADELKVEAEKVLSEDRSAAEAEAKKLQDSIKAKEAEVLRLQSEADGKEGEEAAKALKAAELAREKAAKDREAAEATARKLKREMEEAEKAEARIARVGLHARRKVEEAEKRSAAAEAKREEESQRKLMVQMMGASGATGAAGSAQAGGDEIAMAAVIRSATGAASKSMLKAGATGAMDGMLSDPDLMGFREAGVTLFGADDEEDVLGGPDAAALHDANDDAAEETETFASAADARARSLRLLRRVARLESRVARLAHVARSAGAKAAHVRSEATHAADAKARAQHDLSAATAARAAGQKRMSQAQDAAYQASVEARNAQGQSAVEVARMQEDMASMEIRRAKVALDSLEQELSRAQTQFARAEQAEAQVQDELQRLQRRSARAQHGAEQAGERLMTLRSRGEAAGRVADAMAARDAAVVSKRSSVLAHSFALAGNGHSGVDMGARGGALVASKVVANNAATIEAWVRVDALPHREAGIVGVGSTLMLAVNAHTFQAVAGEAVVEGPLPRAPVGEFVHLAVVVDAERVALLVNGVAINWMAAEKPLAFGLEDALRLLRVDGMEGARATLGPVAIWSRALGDDELREHAVSRDAMVSAITAPAQNGLAVAYTFQAGGALRGMVRDVSASGVDGRIVGRARWVE